MTLAGDRGSPIVCGRWTSPRHKNREGETQARPVLLTPLMRPKQSRNALYYISADPKETHLDTQLRRVKDGAHRAGYQPSRLWIQG